MCFNNRIASVSHIVNDSLYSKTSMVSSLFLLATSMVVGVSAIHHGGSNNFPGEQSGGDDLTGVVSDVTHIPTHSGDIRDAETFEEFWPAHGSSSPTTCVDQNQRVVTRSDRTQDSQEGMVVGQSSCYQGFAMPSTSSHGNSAGSYENVSRSAPTPSHGHATPPYTGQHINPNMYTGHFRDYPGLQDHTGKHEGEVHQGHMSQEMPVWSSLEDALESIETPEIDRVILGSSESHWFGSQSHFPRGHFDQWQGDSVNPTPWHNVNSNCGQYQQSSGLPITSHSGHSQGSAMSLNSYKRHITPRYDNAVRGVQTSGHSHDGQIQGNPGNPAPLPNFDASLFQRTDCQFAPCNGDTSQGLQTPSRVDASQARGNHGAQLVHERRRSRAPETQGNPGNPAPLPNFDASLFQRTDCQFAPVHGNLVDVVAGQTYSGNSTPGASSDLYARNPKRRRVTESSQHSINSPGDSATVNEQLGTGTGTPMYENARVCEENLVLVLRASGIVIRQESNDESNRTIASIASMLKPLFPPMESCVTADNGNEKHTLCLTDSWRKMNLRIDSLNTETEQLATHRLSCERSHIAPMLFQTHFKRRKFKFICGTGEGEIVLQMGFSRAPVMHTPRNRNVTLEGELGKKSTGWFPSVSGLYSRNRNKGEDLCGATPLFEGSIGYLVSKHREFRYSADRNTRILLNHFPESDLTPYTKFDVFISNGITHLLYRGVDSSSPSPSPSAPSTYSVVVNESAKNLIVESRLRVKKTIKLVNCKQLISAEVDIQSIELFGFRHLLTEMHSAILRTVMMDEMVNPEEDR